MDRIKKERINTIIALLNQVVTIICGFILPRFYLQNYGSEVYGLVSSISQFLSFVTLMELGMGAVVQSSLYKPLAKRDEKEISKIIVSADRFFKKIAIILLVYTIILAVVYPFINSGKFGWWFDASLIIIISISLFAEYFFGITYRLLLMADQKVYITYGLATIGIMANFIVCIVLMNAGFSIHLVKLVSASVLLVRPMGQWIYVNCRYHINKRIKYTEEPIQQKWNGIAQHVAYYITNNTDTIILTTFSTLQNVAIYSVYNLVVNGFRQLVLTLNSGTKALYGEMIARDEKKELLSHFLKYEILIHAVVTLFYSCIFSLIIPFVFVYTRGITDVDYIQPVFATLITAAHALYCLRLPYNTLVGAIGHYKQTQTSAVIEMILNLGLSIVLVKKYGLIGVAIGTLVALLYRTIYLAWYARRIILEYRFSIFLRCIFVDTLSFVVITIITKHLPYIVTDYPTWFARAFMTFLIALVVVIAMNIFFNNKAFIPVLKQFGNRFQKG